MLRLSSFLLLLALGHIAARPAGDSGAVEDTSSEGEEHVIHIPVRWDGPPQDPEEEKDVEERREDFPWTGESVSGQGERRTHPAGPQYDDQDEDAANSRYRRSASGRKYRKKGRRVPDFAGDLVFSARRAFRMFFDFDYSALSDADILSAQVLLYHTRPSRTRKSRAADDVRASRSRFRKSARVIMHQTIEFGNDFGTTRATDIKLVEGRTRGWISFDITPALKDWISKPSNNQGLELWIVSATTGRQAAMVASRMKFVKPSSKRVIYRPELVVKLKQNKGNSADLSDE